MFIASSLKQKKEYFNKEIEGYNFRVKWKPV